MNMFKRLMGRADDRTKVTIILNEDGTFDYQCQNITELNKNSLAAAVLKVVKKLLKE